MALVEVLEVFTMHLGSPGHDVMSLHVGLFVLWFSNHVHVHATHALVDALVSLGLPMTQGRQVMHAIEVTHVTQMTSDK